MNSFTTFVKQFNCEWRIKDWSTKTASYGVGKQTIQFPANSAEEVRWCLHLKLDMSGRHSLNISILTKDNKERKISHVFEILDVHRKQKVVSAKSDYFISPGKEVYHEVDAYCKDKITCGVCRATYGEILYIRCRIEESFEIHVFRETSSLEKLLRDESTSDVIISAGDKVFRAHKPILSCCSPVFERMLQCGLSESVQNRIEIVDLSADAVEALLLYMYTGRVKNVGPLVLELLVAADKYDVAGLLEACETPARSLLTGKNALDILNLARRHNAINLVNAAMVFISENVTTMLQSVV